MGVRAYTYLPSRSTAVVGSVVALVRLRTEFAMRRVRAALLSESLPVGGFSVVEIQGRSETREVTHWYQVTFEKGAWYWINGVVAATVARLISDGGTVKAGVHFLMEAVDPVAFMQELRKAGVPCNNPSAS